MLRPLPVKINIIEIPLNIAEVIDNDVTAIGGKARLAMRIYRQLLSTQSAAISPLISAFRSKAMSYFILPCCYLLNPIISNITEIGRDRMLLLFRSGDIELNLGPVTVPYSIPNRQLAFCHLNV